MRKPSIVFGVTSAESPAKFPRDPCFPSANNAEVSQSVNTWRRYAIWHRRVNSLETNSTNVFEISSLHGYTQNRSENVFSTSPVLDLFITWCSWLSQWSGHELRPRLRYRRPPTIRSTPSTVAVAPSMIGTDVQNRRRRRCRAALTAVWTATPKVTQLARRTVLPGINAVQPAIKLDTSPDAVDPASRFRRRRKAGGKPTETKRDVVAVGCMTPSWRSPTTSMTATSHLTVSQQGSVALQLFPLTFKSISS